MLQNIRLRMAYDGARYAGWQIQPDRPTVQGELERALRELTGEPLKVLSAGRTDAGVHALGQVANFHTAFPIPPAKWRAALQARLPGDIIILESDAASLDFHATFSARSKRYRYLILNSIVENPFLSRYSWRISQPLDAAAMHHAAQQLVGKHDFRSFESHWPNKATSVRTVLDVRVTRCPVGELFTAAPLPLKNDAAPADEPMICLEIAADGFLYNMVRTITGTLVNVGRGSWTAADVGRVLRAMDRSVAGGTAPAWGLALVCVDYGSTGGAAVSEGDAAAVAGPL